MIGSLTTMVGVDIGSSQTRAVLAEARPGRDASEPLHVLGVGLARSEGLHGCVVTHLEAATRAARAAIQEAERMAGREVESAYVAVPGKFIQVARSRGIVAVSGAEITAAHVKRVQEVGQAVPIQPGQRQLHALCQDYIVDGRAGVRDPVGMMATRLEADVCIVTAESTPCRDLSKVVDRAGYRPEELILAPLASGIAALDDGERDAGVALLEVGGATTDLMVYQGPRLVHVRTFPWGGRNVTRDIARGLGVPEEEADRLKREHGCARRSWVGADEQLDVAGPSLGTGRRVSRELLAHIIEQRMDEIFGLAYEDLEAAGLLERLGAGLVLTGGGACLEGADDLARSVFNLPVRIGKPGAGLTGAVDALATPDAATAAGLALYGSVRLRSGGFAGATRAISRVGEWLKDFF